MNKKIVSYTIYLTSISSFLIIYRLNNNIPNFTPIISSALFLGIFFKNKIFSVLPMVIMLVSDLFLGFYHLSIMIAVYFSLMAVNLMGILIKDKKSYLKIISASLVGSSLFFVVTNFSVWAFGNWYLNNFSGLTSCFLNAIPFFKNNLLSTFIFSTFFYLIYQLSYLLVKQKAFHLGLLRKITKYHLN
jgi:hypothetical protein